MTSRKKLPQQVDQFTLLSAGKFYRDADLAPGYTSIIANNCFVDHRKRELKDSIKRSCSANIMLQVFSRVYGLALEKTNLPFF